MFLKCPNTNTTCATVQNQRGQNQRNGMFKSHLTIFVSGGKKQQKGKKGVDSAFRDKHTMHLMGTRVGLVT